MHRMILAGSLLLALSTSAVAGQVYKWVDAQGVTHFGAQPPEGQQATSVNTSVPKPRPSLPRLDSEQPEPAVPKSTPVGDQKAIDEKVKADVATQEAERRKYCETIRTNLAQLQNNPRLRAEVDGEMRRLSEEERQSRIKDAEKAIGENCD
jgi:erythromycin esterase-like protein